MTFYKPVIVNKNIFAIYYLWVKKHVYTIQSDTPIITNSGNQNDMLTFEGLIVEWGGVISGFYSS